MLKLFQNITAKLYDRKFLRTLQKSFPCDNRLIGPNNFPEYPPKKFLGDRRINAYSIGFATINDEVEQIHRIMKNQFPEFSVFQNQKGIITNKNNEVLYFSEHQDFNGTTFAIITNSIEILSMLDSFHITVPPPWLAFPRIEDPEAVGSLQGDVEYWWYGLWLPYWNALNNKGKADYLLRFSATKEWIDFIDRHP